MSKDLYLHLSIEELTKEKEFLFTKLDDFKGRLNKFDRASWENERNKNILLEDVNLLRDEHDNRIKGIVDACLEGLKNGQIRVEVVKDEVKQ